MNIPPFGWWWVVGFYVWLLGVSFCFDATDKSDFLFFALVLALIARDWFIWRFLMVCMPWEAYPRSHGSVGLACCPFRVIRAVARFVGPWGMGVVRSSEVAI